MPFYLLRGRVFCCVARKQTRLADVLHSLPSIFTEQAKSQAGQGLLKNLE